MHISSVSVWFKYKEYKGSFTIFLDTVNKLKYTCKYFLHLKCTL